jgi:hypothetical protein
MMIEPTDDQLMELMPQQMRDDLAAAARALIWIRQRANVKAAGCHVASSSTATP